MRGDQGQKHRAYRSRANAWHIMRGVRQRETNDGSRGAGAKTEGATSRRAKRFLLLRSCPLGSLIPKK